MSIEAAFYYEVINTAAISALIGTRFYPLIAPSSVTPTQSYATYQKISNAHEHHQTDRAGLTQARYQINCWSPTQKAASQLAEEFRIALDRFSGAMGEAGSTVTVPFMELASEQDTLEIPNDASQQGCYGITMDFLIWYEET